MGHAWAGHSLQVEGTGHVTAIQRGRDLLGQRRGGIHHDVRPRLP